MGCWARGEGVADSAEVAALRRTLKRHLRDIFRVSESDPAGDFVVREGDVTVRAQPRDWAQGRTLVRVYAVTNVGMRVDGDLTRFLAAENVKLAFGCFELDEATATLSFAYQLPGDFLQRADLKTAIDAVAFTTNRYGSPIKQRFGGLQSSELAVERGMRALSDALDEAIRWSPSAPAEPATPEVQGPDELTRRVERYLTDAFGGSERPSGGAFVVRNGGGVIFVDPREPAPGLNIVVVESITNIDVRVDAELTKFLLTENAKLDFGGFALDDTVPSVVFGHTLLASWLQRSDLEAAVAAVGTVAGGYSEWIKERFGGRLAAEWGATR
jgi:hypothetical protein